MGWNILRITDLGRRGDSTYNFTQLNPAGVGQQAVIGTQAGVRREDEFYWGLNWCIPAEHSRTDQEPVGKG